MKRMKCFFESFIFISNPIVGAYHELLEEVLEMSSSKKRTLTDFSEFENTDNEKDSVNGNTNNDQLYVTVKSNNNTEQLKETLKSSTDNKKETASEFSNTGKARLDKKKGKA
jgi:hypothetical protein